MAIVSLPSWPKTVLFIYLIANLKALPFAWHIRLLYQLIANISRTPIPPKPLLSTSADSPRRQILTHPLFTSVEISTHTPLLETDYNLHKSNSTYLSDIDISRTKLVTRLFSPGFRKLNIQLQDEGHTGRLIIALGGVHMSFRREIAIYERVRIRSRVLTWDGKWLVIVSSFLREGEILCAVGLSRYVLKKGRFTVRPERVLRAAGWLPEKSGEEEPEKSEKSNGREGASSPSLADKGEDGLSRAEHAVEGLKSAQIPELGEKVILEEETAAAAALAAAAFPASEGGKAAWNAESWSWDEIEGERLRGLELASRWLALDAQLYDEFERN